MIRLVLLALVLAPAAPAQVALHDARTIDAAGELPGGAPAGFVRAAVSGGDSVLVGPAVLAIGAGDLTVASVGMNAYTGAPELSVTFARPDALAAVTGARVGQALAFVVDGTVWMAPTVREAITGGRLQISGQFAPGELEPLAARLRAVTGAADPLDAARRALAAAPDASTPEEAVTAFFRAVDLGAWPEAVRRLQPDRRALVVDAASELARYRIAPAWRVVGTLADGLWDAVVVLRPSDPDNGDQLGTPVAVPAQLVGGVWYVALWE